MEEIKSDLHWLMFWCFVTGFTMCFGIWMTFKPKKKKKKKSKSEYPKCDCNDVNQCSKWCHAKAMYTKDWHDGKV